MNMDSKSLTWASSGEIDIIMGGDNARLLVQDNPEMNSNLKPSNLRFYNSPIFKLPLAFGEISGQWIQAKMDETQESEPPDKSPGNNIQPATNVAQLELLNTSKTTPTKDEYIDMKPFSTPNIEFEKSPVLFSVNHFNNKIPIREAIYRNVSRKGKTLGKI